MTFVWIISISVMLLAIALNFSTYGKFWHKHVWQKKLDIESPSIYSPSKVNVHTLYRCEKDNCRGVKTHVSTKGEDNEV